MTSTPTGTVSLPPLSVDALLHAHASAQDPKLAALEQAIGERVGLKSKNEQLWKLIEKQRAGYNQLIQELERMRSERDAYKMKIGALIHPDERKAGGAVASSTADARDDPETPSTARPRHA
ncbi:hypothetical protein DFH08DRAFT_888629 [Mycena albidolilacea]|uniref:Uncharacterized protein n=1 Tax=Mycena albidolilacea TaxID=1033008 RepID=A0AAD6ZH98_9AGAR|nr:hypothetical protein DFH08DRAFT_888629 [Mycena albidolilacea]